jgi:deoxyribonuclease-4
MSIAGGVSKAPGRAASAGCVALQIFVKNNNRWEGPPITDAEAAAFREELAKASIRPEHVFAHTAYLINLASPKEDVHAKSIVALTDELARCTLLGVPGLVMHPGARLDLPYDAAIDRIAAAVRSIYAANSHFTTRLLLEGTAGTGSNLGAPLSELGDILAAIGLPDRTGICLDTCHLFAAGYDLRTPEGYAATFAEFERLIGLKNLLAFHLNDSVFGLGSRKDRHEHIGKGYLGLEPFRHLMNDPRMSHVPMSLETDKDEDLQADRDNLAVLRGLWAGK